MAFLPICSVYECGKPVKARNCCQLHYQRLLKHGDALIRKTTTTEETHRFLKEVVLKHDVDQCLFWPFPLSKAGYARITKNGERLYVHRVVCEHFNGPCPEDMEAAHNCGKGHLGCVAPKHIRWDTRKGNQLDRKIHGTANEGEQHNFAKLTKAKVEEIKSLLSTHTRNEISAMFDVTPSLISAIKLNKIWKN